MLFLLLACTLYCQVFSSGELWVHFWVHALLPNSGDR